jgi:hypothetical protein
MKSIATELVNKVCNKYCGETDIGSIYCRNKIDDKIVLCDKCKGEIRQVKFKILTILDFCNERITFFQNNKIFNDEESIRVMQEYQMHIINWCNSEIKILKDGGLI